MRFRDQDNPGDSRHFLPTGGRPKNMGIRDPGQADLFRKGVKDIVDKKDILQLFFGATITIND